MKRHISIFAFLLGAFATAVLAPSASAGVQTITGGDYHFDGTWKGTDVKYMSAPNGKSKIVIADLEETTFTAHPDPGMKVVNWAKWTGSWTKMPTWLTPAKTEETFTLIGNSAEGDAFLAVNFTYIPLIVKTNGHEFVTGDIHTEMTLPVLSKEGYTGKWKNEKGKTFEFGEKVSGKDFWYEADGAQKRDFYANLTADWTPNTYTIVFDGNEATGGSMEPMSCTYGKSETLTKNAFERSLYEFDCWTTNSVGSGHQFKDGESVQNLTAENGGTVTMFAQWKKASCRVEVRVASSSSGKGSVSPSGSVTKEAGTDLELTATSNPGYAFAQWSDGSTEASRTLQAVSNATYEATFTNRVFTMTFDVNDKGQGATCDVTSKKVIYQDPIGALPNPVWEFHVFDGWWTAREGGDQVAENSASGTTMYTWVTDLPLYAHWTEAKGYDITAECDPKRGTVKVEGTKVGGKFVENTEVVFTATANTGYSFSHWEKGQSVYTDNPLTNIATESVTYIGVFTGNVYKVTFLSLEGLPTQQEKFVTFGSAYGTLPTVENVKDRVLDGWYTGLSGSGTKIEPTTEVDQPNNDRILFANWKDAPVYYIAFDGNGATNETTMADQKAYCGEDVVLTSNQYARTGYTFEYWTNSVGTVYRDGATVRDLAGTNETATLYATWSPISYTLAFDSQGGDFGQEVVPMDCFYGREYELQYKEGTKELCDFAGWSNAWNGAVYSAANGFKAKDAYDVPNGTNTLIAIWNSQLTDYSLAMHCTNLVWDVENGHWWCVTNSSAGYDPSGTCVRGEFGGALTTTVTTNGGTLAFWWKSSKTGRYATLVVEVSSAQTNLIARAADTWQFVEIPISSGVGVHPVKLTLGWDNDYIIDIDQMTWTPKALHPVPDPKKDFVTISSAAVSDGKFSLSFEFNGDFDYLLKTNANLLIDRWGVMEIKGTKTGNILTFEPKIIEGQSQLFYKVETIQKKN